MKDSLVLGNISYAGLIGYHFLPYFGSRAIAIKEIWSIPCIAAGLHVD